MPSDPDRGYVGNHFARALRGRAPDDEKATSPVLYVLFGLLSLVLVALFVAALVLPPLFTHTLIVRGIRTGRPVMWLLGLTLALGYFAAVLAIGRKLMRRPPPPPEE